VVDREGRALSEKPGQLRLVFDPFTGLRNAPNQHAQSFTVDTDGFRGGYRGEADRPLAFLLGGSAVFGQGVDRDDDTLSAVLARTSPRYRFVNAGVVGYESGQELALMVNALDRLSPRLYVVCDGWNDVFAHVTQATAHEPLGATPYLHDMERRLRALLVARSAPGAGDQPRPADEYGRRWVADRRYRFERVRDEYLRNLRLMATFAHARGAAMLVVFQPEVGCRPRPTEGEVAARRGFVRYGSDDPALRAWYAEMGAAAGAQAQASGYTFLDANTAAFCDAPEPLFIDPVHLNVEGYARLARYIAPHLP
jgi:lysophospholipase L1-like esterase